MNLAAPAWGKTKAMNLHTRTPSTIEWQQRNGSADMWECLYGQLPPKDRRIKEGWVDLRVSAPEYRRFFIILTSNALYIANPVGHGVANIIKFEHLERNVLQGLESVASTFGGKQNSMVKAATGAAGSISSFLGGVTPSSRGPTRLQSLGILSPIRVSKDQDVNFKIETTLPGHAETITYNFRTDDEEEGIEWVECLKTQVAIFKRPKRRDHPMWQLVQSKTDEFYHNMYTQTFFGVMIFANFILQAVQAEIKPAEGSAEHFRFFLGECIFTGIFTLEILLHVVALADRLNEFVENYWNIFDVLVVLTSIISALTDFLPGLGILRIIRAFRLLRLFGRLSTLRRITNALLGSWLPVINAMTVVLFTTGVYGILATQFFSKNSPQHFGSFTRSLVTMFTVMTFDGWVDMMWNDLSESAVNPGVIIFFVTFIVIVVWTMLSVVVGAGQSLVHDPVVYLFYPNLMKHHPGFNLTLFAAIMLDNFASASEKKEVVDRVHNCLDPFLQELSIFISHNDLPRRVEALFHALDFEGLGSIGRIELCDGFRKLHKCPVRIGADDFHRITNWGELCDDQGLIGVKELHKILHFQILDLIQEKSSQEISRTQNERGLDSQGILLCSVKMLHLDVNRQELIAETKKEVADLSVVIQQMDSRQQKIEKMLEKLLQAQQITPMSNIVHSGPRLQSSSLPHDPAAMMGSPRPAMKVEQEAAPTATQNEGDKFQKSSDGGFENLKNPRLGVSKISVEGLEALGSDGASTSPMLLKRGILGLKMIQTSDWTGASVAEASTKKEETQAISRTNEEKEGTQSSEPLLEQLKASNSSVHDARVELLRVKDSIAAHEKAEGSGAEGLQDDDQSIEKKVKDTTYEALKEARTSNSRPDPTSSIPMDGHLASRHQPSNGEPVMARDLPSQPRDLPPNPQDAQELSLSAHTNHSKDPNSLNGNGTEASRKVPFRNLDSGSSDKRGIQFSSRNQRPTAPAESLWERLIGSPRFEASAEGLRSIGADWLPQRGSS